MVELIEKILSYNTTAQILSWPFKSKENFVSTTIPLITFIGSQMLCNISYSSSLILSGIMLGSYKIYTIIKTDDKFFDRTKAKKNEEKQQEGEIKKDDEYRTTDVFEELARYDAKAEKELAEMSARLKDITTTSDNETNKLLDDMLNTPSIKFNNPKICENFQNRSMNISEIATQNLDSLSQRL